MVLKEKFTLSIGDNITGSPLSVLGYRFSQGNGSSIYIQGGTHGGEITFPIFKMLSNFLEKNTEWQGTVTLIPLSHPISWNQRHYYYTAGKFDNYNGKDWNRSFPGNKDGSTTERISKMIFDEAIKHDLILDLHTSRRSKPFTIVSREDLVEYAINSGILPIYLAPKSSSNFPFTDAIDNAGKKGITIECGSHDSMNQDDFSLSFNAVLNVFRKEKLLNDNIELKKVDGVFVFEKYETYFAPISGFVEYLQPLEKLVKKGEILYRIHASNSLNEAIDVLAIENSIIMKYQSTHIATIGDEVVTVVTKYKYI
ncbi:MAG: succinylglutamate desuccinylase/aspartoacylase family protein [Candidatus Nomurabacteria bacterium]|nr:succinylglutamate desuccinylase/aspartoacylase family protein [Candidatus Nomurabacteria bacterium]